MPVIECQKALMTRSLHGTDMSPCMVCADDEDGSDDEVGLESTAAAIHAQSNPGRKKKHKWLTK